MRLRNKKTAQNFIENSNKVITINQMINDRYLQESFFDATCFSLEIGSGKGDFIITNSYANPNKKFIGIEKHPTVLMSAIKKLQNLAKNELQNQNCLFICGDAIKILPLLPKHKIDKIFLNFSDPWPKKRYYKRRLTSEVFINFYYELLSSVGEVHLKTDNFDFFNFSRENFSDKKWKEVICEFDLYKSFYLENNIATEYEKKFHTENKKIAYLVVRKSL